MKMRSMRHQERHQGHPAHPTCHRPSLLVVFMQRASTPSHAGETCSQERRSACASSDDQARLPACGQTLNDHGGPVTGLLRVYPTRVTGTHGRAPVLHEQVGGLDRAPVVHVLQVTGAFPLGTWHHMSLAHIRYCMRRAKVCSSPSGHTCNSQKSAYEQSTDEKLH